MSTSTTHHDGEKTTAMASTPSAPTTRGPRRPRILAAALAAVAALLAGGIAWATSATAGSDHAVPPHALAGFGISVTPDASIGDTVTVSVSATAQDLYAYDLKLSFDPAVLSYVSAATDVSGSTYGLPSGDTVDVIHTKLGSSPAASGPVTLATVTFRAVGAGSTSVDVASLQQVSSSVTSTTTPDVAAETVRVTAKPVHTVVRLSMPKRARAHQRVTIVATVATTGTAQATVPPGRVRIAIGTRNRLVDLVHGKATLKIAAGKRGHRSVTAAYVPGPGFVASQAKKALTVR